MHHSVDKKLTGWLHWKSCGQQLNVQVESIESGIPKSIKTSTA